MAQNFLNLIKPQADVSKNVFDLSRKHVFSSKIGQLLPVLSVETVPGDKFKIDLASLQRTMTLNTAAFVRGKFKYDFFFVPYSQLWHPFNQFITQRNDKHSTTQNSHNWCPVFNLSSVLYYLWQMYNSDIPSTKDVFGYDACYDAVRLLDLLGYGNFDHIFSKNLDQIQDFVNDFGDVYVNPFRLAAYQHIFYDYYRNKYYDVDDVAENGIEVVGYYRNYLNLFNFDDINCSSFAQSIIPYTNGVEFSRLMNLFTIRYHQWKKDLFTSALPSQQFGSVSTVDINDVTIYHKDHGNSTQTAFIMGSTGNLKGGNNTEPRGDNYWTIPNAFDVLSVRKAELLQRWKQNTLRAGNMTDDSFRAHFGVEPFYDSDENVRYLGSFESALQINPIEATASTAGSINGMVGDIAATGTSVTNGKPIHFECNDFGIIQCIACFVPDVEYRSDMIDKANRLQEQFDFFTPEFQNIGLDPLIGADFASSRSQDVSSSFRNGVFGYAPRYWQYKTAVDKCFGQFSHGVLAPWVAPRDQSRTSSTTGEQMLGNFYVKPNIYDDIFAIQSDEQQNTDCFLNNVFFDIKAIRPMSVLGLPEF